MASFHRTGHGAPMKKVFDLIQEVQKHCKKLTTKGVFIKSGAA